MAGRRLGDPGRAHRGFDGALQVDLAEWWRRTIPERGSTESPTAGNIQNHPSSFPSVWTLPFQGVGKVNAWMIRPAIGLKETAHGFKMKTEVEG